MTETATLSRSSAALQDSIPVAPAEAPKLTVYTERQLDKIPQIQALPAHEREAIRVVANVLPFRVNQYVCEELIDWSNWKNDPIFRLTFPQKEMLMPETFEQIADILKTGDKVALKDAVNQVRETLNPHPAGQMDLNVPKIDGVPVQGIQHKYRETVLFFPSQGQTCHTYCTFCFRWAQFIGDKDLKFANSEASAMVEYLKANPQVTDILITGGDPLVMKTKNLRVYLEALLDPELEHVQTIRIGSKSLTFWPQRFVTDPDADELLMVFEKLIASGKHLAFMAHYNHWREMEPEIARTAIRRIRATGAQIRSQGPLLKNINDSAEVWAQMWKTQVKLGVIPYYMFVERDTGARHYFEVPLAQAWTIYRDALQQVSGLARTVRGPSMSSEPGKVEIQGVTEVAGEKVFVLRFLQGRDSDWVQKPFFAKYDENATWLHHLKPAFGDSKFFFEK
ncbi:L-lysine 2,3-aminomutase [Oleiphilus messinensis]|uniref:L-lysine 2,3-aminomutase n=1 Tax=Oleiphilus messinensis TaxID=141451 RepID=A0A1Y0I1Z4_9GAMM|nr:lysine 2,3-aminomutase [Oleiphilus messinensis]ARU54518.1 L-lysine 2,3-aminomutase [Oleiphilus messinensis]